MVNCCEAKETDRQCLRKPDNRKFSLPRKFSKKQCIQGPEKFGFSRRASCAPYKNCKLNVFGEALKSCSMFPRTGYYRNGYCVTGPADKGTHTVCAKIDDKFLKYTKSRGNNLEGVVKPGKKWCICENRWMEAYKNGKAPDVVLNATNQKIRKNTLQKIFNMKRSKAKR